MPALARTDPRHYTPSCLPPELHAFAGPVAQLDVGRPGKVGLLELSFAPVAGITRLVRHYQQVPLQIFRPLYVDPCRPDMAVVYVVQTGGGVVQGDRSRIDLVCEPGTAVHLTTQAATKVYRMERSFATQIVRLKAGADAFVEYLPDPIIPFRGARFYGRTELVVDPTATVIVGETLLPGRVAHGECHAYTFFCGQIEALAPDGALLFADTVKLDPRRRSLASPGRLGPFDVLATLYVVTRRIEPRLLVERLREVLSASSPILAGVSELPNRSGVGVRLLGTTSATVQAAQRTAWNAARLALSGAPAPDLRKG